MKYIKIGFVLAFLCSTLFAKEITINFQSTPIVDVIKFVAAKTKKNILINEAISGKVNFLSNKPIDDSELLPLLEHILMVKGYTLSKSSKGYIEIVRAARASKNVSLDDTTTIGMKMVILRPKYSKASVVLTKIKHLASQYAIITTDDAMGLILVSDYPQNIKKMEKLLQLFDIDSKRDIQRIELKHYSVKIAMQKLKTIFNATKDSYKDTIKLMADAYQNALWVSANIEDIKKAVTFIKDFDLHGEDATRMDTKILFLKNANVEDIVKTAQEIAKSKDINAPIKSVITSNKELNAIIISSTVKQINELTKLIKKIDIQRRQVFVKVNIYEVSDAAVENMGIKWGLGGGAVTGTTIATGQVNMGGSAFALPDVLAQNIDFGSLSKGLAIGATIDFLKNNGAATIISEPDILSINNVKSTIYVGKTQSILTSSSTGASTTDTTRNSYSREDIGLTLEITPQIADKDNVVLKILINAEDIDKSTTATDKPTTTKRKVDTTAIVQNEDSIIIGGLIRNTHSTNKTKVPLLGDIPFLGALFRSTTQNNDRVSTIMIVTPYIVTNSKDLKKVQTKLERMKALQRQMSQKIENNFEKLEKKKKKESVQKNQDPMRILNNASIY